MHPSTFSLRTLRLALLVAFLALPVLARAAERIDLDGSWLFLTDPKSEGEAQSWFKTTPTGTESVRVPHTWNIGKYDDYEGIAWYFRMFGLPALSPHTHVELHFAATFYLSHIWVNGAEAGSHEGGHTEYFFDITKLLKPGQNTIAVELDNRPTETGIPGLALKLRPGGNIWYDWWHYGGIVRNVWLSVNEGVLIRRQQIRSDVDLTKGSAQIQNAVYVENSGNKPQKLTVTAHLSAQLETNHCPASVSAPLRATIPSRSAWPPRSAMRYAYR
jgi:beta-glucuronidase